jgi:hypothetical protein
MTGEDDAWPGPPYAEWQPSLTTPQRKFTCLPITTPCG